MVKTNRTAKLANLLARVENKIASRVDRLFSKYAFPQTWEHEQDRSSNMLLVPTAGGCAQHGMREARHVSYAALMSKKLAALFRQVCYIPALLIYL